MNYKPPRKSDTSLADKILEETPLNIKIQVEITLIFEDWLDKTGRSGGVLLGRSIREFFKYYADESARIQLRGHSNDQESKEAD